MEGAFCMCRVHRIVHEASEGRRSGWTVERTPGDVVRDAGGERTFAEAQHERLR